MSDDRLGRLEEKIDELTRAVSGLVGSVMELKIRGEAVVKLEARLTDLEKSAVEKAHFAKIEDKVEALERWRMYVLGAAAMLGAMTGGLTHAFAGLLGGK